MVACIYIAPDQPSSITPVVTLAAERPWPLVFLATTPRLVGKSLAHALSRTPRKMCTTLSNGTREQPQALQCLSLHQRTTFALRQPAPNLGPARSAWPLTPVFRGGSDAEFCWGRYQQYEDSIRLRLGMSWK